MLRKIFSRFRRKLTYIKIKIKENYDDSEKNMYSFPDKYINTSIDLQFLGMID